MSVFYQEGRYLGEVTQQALGEAKTGNAQIVLKFRVLEEENGAPVQQQYERSVFLTITENTIKYLVPKLKAIGYTRDSFAYIDTSRSNHHSLISERAIFVCKHETNNDGLTREKWDVGISESGPIEVKPLEPSKLRKLDSLFGKELKQLSVNAPKPEASATVIDDSDVAF